MTKARLISLLLFAAIFAFYLGLLLKPIGLNDGGFW